MERTQTTRVGPTNKHEMCNLYLMYYATTDMAWQVTHGDSGSARPPQTYVPGLLFPRSASTTGSPRWTRPAPSPAR